MSSQSSNNSPSILARIEASRFTPGLYCDEKAIVRFIQGMSAEKKELIALGFINEMSDGRKADIEREILGDIEDEVKLNNIGKNPVSILRSTASKIFFSAKKKTTASKAA
jgi:hypothetical protein